MSVVDDSFDHPLKIEEEATAPLAGGIMGYGYQCGMLWGAALAAGAQAFRLLGPGSQAETESIVVAQRLVKSFQIHTKNEINCLEITNLNLHGKIEPLPVLKFIITGGPIGCFRMAADYAPDVYRDINRVLSEKHCETPSGLVSCAAMLADKMGASEMHTVMAAGFAGGIGLSGGTCGALGAAIWLIGFNSKKELLDSKVSNSRINDTIERFLNSSDFEFECSKIVGRKFEDPKDHADYLREGGCMKIIEALAAQGAAG
jgi:hypothetical protein